MHGRVEYFNDGMSQTDKHIAQSDSTVFVIIIIIIINRHLKHAN